ncbi:MAG: hypothetical protein HQM09_21110 [Candidatus Riflebacteria bacterium]|nr:hypothetical protein [Candidatus Riflebacteria bacterium]
MRRIIFFLILLLTFVTGCLFENRGDLSTGALSIISSDSHSASVRFVVVLPGKSSRVMDYSIRATSNSIPQVKFSILVVNPVSAATPFTTFSRTVMIASGSAQTTMVGFPEGRSIIGRVEITGGHIGGYTMFQGAADLVVGENTITVAPIGSRLDPDLLAHILFSSLSSADVRGSLPSNAVQTAQIAIAGVNHDDPTAYEAGLNSFAERLVIANRISVSMQNGDSLSGVTNSNVVWNETSGTILAGSNLGGATVDDFFLDGLIRPSLDGYAIAGWANWSGISYVIANISAVDGSKRFMFINDGLCRLADFPLDGGILLAGTSRARACPVLVKWSMSGNLDTSNQASFIAGKDWIRSFPEFVPDSFVTEPGIEFVQNMGDGRILCGIRSSADRLLHRVFVNSTDGTVISSESTAVLRVAGVASDAAVLLSWEPVAGATDYTIYQSTISGGAISGISTTTENLELLQTGLLNNTTYYFVVQANGLTSVIRSPEIAITPQLPTPLVKEFDLPTGYSSIGFPASGSNAAISGLTTGMTIFIALMNRTNATATVSLSAAQSSVLNSVETRNNLAPEIISTVNPPFNFAVRSPEQSFHYSLRQFEHKLPAPRSRIPVSRSVRHSDFVGDIAAFSIFGTPNVATITGQCIRSDLIPGFSNYLNIYLDSDLLLDSGAITLVNQLASTWPSIYVKDRNIFGEEPTAGFDSNPVISNDIFMLISKKFITAGFFYSGDLYAPSRISNGISNQKKMFYLQYGIASVDGLKSTMAHEFQHMIFFNQRQNTLANEDWLNEGMSGYAEHVNGFGIAAGNQSKAIQVENFLTGSLKNPGDPRIPIYSHSLLNWTQTNEDYGRVYLFGTWLGQRFGTNGSVQNHLKAPGVGPDAVAAFTNQPFASVFAQWSLALWVDQVGAGTVYGFDDIDLRKTYSFAPLADVTLMGPAVFKNNGVFSPYSTGNITIAPFATAYVELTGGNGNPVTLTLPNTVDCFQLLK